MTTLSCSNDDDTSEPIKEYFPTKIETINPTDSNSNGTLNIAYTNQNKISKLTYLNGLNTTLLEITYSTDNKITQIKSTKTTSSTNNQLNFNYIYTNNVISQIIISNAIDAETLQVMYNSTTKTYTIDDGTTATNYFTYDDNGNLKEFVYGLSLSLNYNGQKGIYNGIDNSFPLFFTSLLSGFEGTLIYSHFFSNKELISMGFSSGSLSTVIIRDSNNNISKVDYKNPATNEVSFTSTIEYELRTIN